MNEIEHIARYAHTGTLAGDAIIYTYLDSGATLLRVSAIASNNSSATFKVGIAGGDDDYYVASADVGDSGAWVHKDAGDWAATITTENPHIAAGGTIMTTVDFDGAGGTAAQNLCVELRLLLDS